MTDVVGKPCTALVTGAAGIQGRHLLQKLVESDEWQTVYAISRKTADFSHDKVHHISVDLQQAPVEVLAELQSKHVRGVTHMFHTDSVGTVDDEQGVETNETKLSMLKTAVEAVEKASSDLKHINIITSTKRQFPSEFHIEEEEYLTKRVAEGADWTWSALRAGLVCGVGGGGGGSIVTCTALYATLAKEMDLAHLRFPGTELAYNAALDCVDADLLADAQIFLSTHPGEEQTTANQSFNISNGDVTRWKWIWAVVARHFGMEVGEPQELSLASDVAEGTGSTETLSLASNMADKGPTWERIVEKHGLSQSATWQQLGTWTFADSKFHQSSDCFTNTNKLKRTGFTGMRTDTDDMWARQLQQLADMKIIPSYNAGGVAETSDKEA